MSEWFLPRSTRPWTDGNQVTPLVHGATYFDRLVEVISAAGSGDRIFFTDWGSDSDERLREGGPTVGELFCDAARRGVEVRGLLWRSHSDRMRMSAQENQHLGLLLNEAGGETLLDQRVRRGGSHHQKLVVVRRQGRPTEDVAFVGGIDLCHGRRDDAGHQGDPQPFPLDKRYGPKPPWHDAMLEIRGPAVAEVLDTFSERWDDPTPLDRRTPYRRIQQRLARMPRHPRPLPERWDPPPAAGTHRVQLLRTYPAKRPNPDLHVIAVVPRFPEDDTATGGPPMWWGQRLAHEVLSSAGGERFAMYDLENGAGTPVYVHAKICIVDDTWMTVGSDNLNLRSWTHDSELTAAVVDPDGELPGRLRRMLWAEHLNLDPDDPRLADPGDGGGLWRSRTAEQDSRARPHEIDRIDGVKRWYAAPAYRALHDPDGRPRHLRRSTTF
jgi:phosphatidylserine/phosphatidylglycerophosphate/cardiolipin synthase-like enzyme